MGDFAVTDTVEYLLDYVESQDAIMCERPTTTSFSSDRSESSDNSIELTLSYPNRVINRQLDPNTTLADLNINEDSVVWVSFV